LVLAAEEWEPETVGLEPLVVHGVPTQKAVAVLEGQAKAMQELLELTATMDAATEAVVVQEIKVPLVE